MHPSGSAYRSLSKVGSYSLKHMTMVRVITEQVLEMRMKSRHNGWNYSSQDVVMTQKGSGLDWM
jgi:hypothetical protein